VDREEAKRRLGIPANRLLIGAIGRLSEEKGFDLLIAAVDRLLEQGFDVELRIAGEGDQQDYLARLIRAKGREDRIRLVGYQAQTIPLYEAMDVFVLSSLREGLPNVVLEAMAMEVPVIATRVAGIPRLVHHGQNGLLIEPGSTPELTDALLSVLQDGPLRDLLALDGRATIEQNHSFEVRMEKIRAAYDRLLGKDLTSTFPSKAALIS